MAKEKHKYMKLFGGIFITAIALMLVAVYGFGIGKVQLQANPDTAAACAAQGGTWNGQICTVGGGGGGGTGFVCNTPSYMIRATDAYTGSALTEANNLEHVVGDKQGFATWTAGTAIATLNPGSPYEFIPGISTSSFTGNAFALRYTIPSLPCRADTTIKEINDATTFTATTFNQNGAAQSASTNPIGALTSGQTVTVSIRKIAGSQTTFGNTFLKDDTGLSDIGQGASIHRKMYPNCECLVANSTWLDTSKPITSYITSNTPSYTTLGGASGIAFGGPMNRINNPLILSPTTGKQGICFESEVPNDVQYDQYFTFTTKAAINPAGLDNFTVSEYPANYFKDQYGNILWDCNTDGGAAVGASVVTSTFYI